MINHRYGSEARGDAHVGSDIDLLILVNKDKLTLDDEEKMNCISLRKALKTCNDLPQPFYRTDTQDAGEFLLYLFNKFELTIATQYQYTYVSNDNKNYIEISRRELKTDPVVQIL